MRYVQAAGANVSVIGLGCWQFGSREWGYGEDYASREAPAIVRRALDLGITLLDTAEIYGFGRSERILGEAIRGRRESAFVATKIMPVLPVPPIVRQRARASARRLGVDALDLYQLHWPNPVVGIGPAIAGMRRLLDDGLVRHVGVSNYSLRAWLRAESALGGPVLSNQVRYSLVSRGPERELIPHARAAGRLVIAYSPLAQGLLSGRYGDVRPRGGVRRTNPLFSTDNLRRASELTGVLRDVAGEVGATPSQVALAWTIRGPCVVAIPGASSVGQVESNAAAAEIVLSDEQSARLASAADRFRPVTGLRGVVQVARERVRSR